MTKITYIPGEIANAAIDEQGNRKPVTRTHHIFDDNLEKNQAEINAELIEAVGTGGFVDSRIAAAVNVEKTRAEGAESTLEGKITIEKNRAEAAEGAINGRVDTLEDAVGTGGSIDSRISSAVNSAKSEIKGNATSACDTLGEAEALISAEATRAQAAESNLNSGKADKATTLAGYGITDAYTKSETYTKTEVNGLVDTPHQEYVTVDAYASLPATGSKDTIYRVSNYNGSTSQVDASVYSEYAWDGTQYIFLCVKSQIGEVFDISVYNNNAKYSDLADALGTNGEHVPQSLQKGGMSVKFVCTYDNKYVKFFCTADEFTTDVTQWSDNQYEKPIINCIGDSVTEGMFMDGGGYAEYGKEPYPAQLYTMLVDNGYENYSVLNQGQGGETIPTMAARLGAKTCYVNAAVALPNGLNWVTLSHTTSIGDGNLSIYFSDLNNKDYHVRFTSVKQVTTPVLIDDNWYDFRVVTDWSTYYNNQIKKQSIDNTATKIPKGATVITPAKNAYINIIYGGINDGLTINFAKWSELCTAMLQESANKGLVIGFSDIWKNWNDINGSSTQEKYVDFKTRAYRLWGDRFLDLYDLFYRHALDICLAKGYYSDKTPEEIASMRALLEQHILPAEMSYDYAHQGDVHLSKEGYYAMAKLIFDRIVALRYVNK